MSVYKDKPNYSHNEDTNEEVMPVSGATWLIIVRRQASRCAIGMIGEPTDWGKSCTRLRSLKRSWGLIRKTLAYIDKECENPKGTETDETRGKPACLR